MTRKIHNMAQSMWTPPLIPFLLQSGGKDQSFCGQSLEKSFVFKVCVFQAWNCLGKWFGFNAEAGQRVRASER